MGLESCTSLCSKEGILARAAGSLASPLVNRHMFIKMNIIACV